MFTDVEKHPRIFRATFQAGITLKVGKTDLLAFRVCVLEHLI
jgi:hypothetical protein